QDVFDELGLRARVALDDLDGFVDHLRADVLAEQTHPAEDGAERRTQLVGQGGEKDVLGLVRRLALLNALLLAQIGDDHTDILRPLRRERADGQEDRPRRAVDRQPQLALAATGGAARKQRLEQGQVVGMYEALEGAFQKLRERSAEQPRARRI